ncbi:thermonuclease family protein [Paenibacillus sp. CC-CFT747]|nr:thermonuclease family protein [Paenibacillus sp. CC-CFT747]
MPKSKLWKVLGWIFIPYFMILFTWKRLGNVVRILGAAWAVIALLMVIGAYAGDDKQLASPTSTSPAPSVVPTASPVATAAATTAPSPFASVTPSQTASPAVNDTKLIDVKIVKVTDGDTMDVSFGGKTESVRLLLVDTPETVHPDKPVQPFGPEASQFAKDTLTGKDVKMEIDVSERDKYGRLLAYLYVGDHMFNEMLLEKGLARVAYIIPPNVKYVDQFRAIEKKAQLAGVGIWSIENYAQEDGFHEEITQPAKTATPTIKPTPAPTKKPATAEKSTNAGCSNPTIKGNLSSSGEKIYHVPGGQSYEKTDAEQMFCTKEEAEKAGFRASKR